MSRTVFQQISNDIQVATDTGNSDHLYSQEYAILRALEYGDITVVQAAELQQDVLVGHDSLSRSESLDEVFAARSERTLDELENA